MAGLRCSLITNSSATLDMMGVKAIGRRCLFTLSTGVVLGMGTTLDVFQTDVTSVLRTNYLE